MNSKGVAGLSLSEKKNLLKKILSQDNSHNKEDIAIVGISGRYPDADNLDEFWANLKEGKNCIKEINKLKRNWQTHSFYSNNYNKMIHSYTKWGGFINDVDKFDSLLFQISPNEAKNMDPQERIMLELIWELYEDANYSINSGRELNTNTGVFIGVMNKDYEYIGGVNMGRENQIGASSAFWSIANRISYFYNLSGPSLALDTACSSSLTAIHYACESIKNGECEEAIAGGINLILHPSHFIQLCNMEMLSHGNKNMTFSKHADGFVVGEGAGAILLKPLNKAKKDGDRIYGIVKATAINSDGRTNGYTVPNLKAQKRLITSALKKANINPESISYYEAHGTGTVLGDPIEIEAATSAYGVYTDKKQYCAIGSVKTNIGHTESASGIAAVTKVLLQIQHKELVPSIHAEEINERLNLADSPFRIQEKFEKWDVLKGQWPRRAALSSFGAGGTNAHLVVEEPDIESRAKYIDRTENIFVLSANSEYSLMSMVEKMCHYLDEGTNVSLDQLCYTLQVGRTVLKERLAIIINDVDDLRKKLKIFLEKKQSSSIVIRGSVRPDEQDRRSLDVSDLRQISDGWVCGVKVDWSALYGELPQLISLPHYCFEKKRHWVESKADLKNVLYYKKEWQKSNHINIKTKPYQKKILIFSLDDKEWKLTNEPNNQVVVYPKHIQIKRKHTYSIDYLNQADYIQLKKQLKKVGFSYDTILYYNKMRFDNIKDIITTAEHYRNLAQIFLKDNQKNIRWVNVFSSNVYDHSYLNSLSAMIPSLKGIMPNIICQHLELHGYCGEDENSAILLELKQSKDYDTQVMYHNDQRFIQVHNQVSLKNTNSMILKENGCYIITGGLGALGKIVATYLVNKYHARVLLLGRTKEAKISEENKQFLHSHRNVSYYSLDITDIEQLKNFYHIIKGESIAVNGIIHVAGVTGESIITQVDGMEFNDVFAAKIIGTWNIDEVFKKELLDVFINFSSVSSIIGDFGQCSYAVANNYLSMFAIHRNKLKQIGLRRGDTYNIGWPIWRSGGMHLEENAEKFYLEACGLTYLEEEEGIRILENILAQEEKDIYLLCGNQVKIENTIKNLVKTEGYEIVEKIERTMNNSDMIRSVVSEIIGISINDIEDHCNFGEYGFDSISLRRLSIQLSDIYNIQLNPALLFYHSSIAELAKYIEEEVDRTVVQEGTIECIDNVAADDIERSVAIIGMSGLFPKSNNTEEFWEQMYHGEQMIEEIPEERWQWKDYFGDPQKEEGVTNSKWGGFIPDVDKFDAKFFKLSPAEAELMDPQQRLYLQTIWHCIEDAGYNPDDLQGSDTGIFTGVQFSDYASLVKKEGILNAQSTTGNAQALISNRISYFLDLHGPSESIDTACSGSLTAIHHAVTAIQNHECTMALAGGVSLMLEPNSMIGAAELGILSGDGTCKVLDAKANGYVKGEGIGAILLKPLNKAVEDRDHILGVIKGSVINHGGRSNSLTSPNAKAQAELIKTCYKRAGFQTNTLSYIELHGTGTVLGDPIEIEALKTVFNDTFNSDDEMPYCALGSVKSNIGHLEPAAGIAGVLKVLLCMKYKKILKINNFQQLNPLIDLNNTAFYVPLKNSEWETQVKSGKIIPRRAGISSFGFGGANAHIALEDYSNQSVCSSEGSALILLSANSKGALIEYATKLYQQVERENWNNQTMHIAAGVLQQGRRAMSHRLAFVADNTEHLIHQLNCFCADKEANYFYGVCQKNNNRGLSPKEKVDKRLLTVAEYWVKGNSYDWKKLFNRDSYEKCQLPGYPFEKKRYWLSGSEEPSAEKDIWIYREIFQECKIPRQKNIKEEKIICLIATNCDDDSLEQVVKGREGDNRYIIIKRGDNSGQRNKYLYTLKNDTTEEFKHVFDEIMLNNEKLDIVMHLNGVFDTSYTALMRSVLSCTASIKNIMVKHFFVLGEVYNKWERRHFESFVGIERTLERQIPTMQTKVIYEVSSSRKKMAQNISKWLDRLEFEQVDKESVCYEEGIRYKREIVEEFLPDHGSVYEGKNYIITGGTGGLGILFARYLCSRKAANIFLIGRAEASSVKEKLDLFHGYETNVIYLQGDISNVADSDKVIGHIQETGDIHGVIHAAGVNGMENIQENDAFLQVLAPKMDGTENLNRIFSTHHLDFLCLFSSLSATIGDIGSCDYAVANRYMHSFADFCELDQVNYPIISIQWPLWNEGGMHYQDEGFADMYLQVSGQNYMTQENGFEVFNRAVASRKNKAYIVTCGNKSKIEKMLRISEVDHLLSDGLEQIETVLHASDQESKCVQQMLKQDIMQIIHKQLKLPLEELIANEKLVEFGYDSVLLAEFAIKLQSYFSIVITPAIFYSYYTINKLVDYYITNHVSKLSEFYHQKQGKESTAVINHKNDRKIESQDQEIAIIGMSGKFSDCDSTEAFWELLKNEKNAVRIIGNNRCELGGISDTSVKGGYLPGIEEFDPLFFEISPREAAAMDPRQRILMQEVWKALEDAGYGENKLSKECIYMYVGAEEGDYQELSGDNKSITSDSTSLLAARLAYYLDIKGAAMVINTACSSGLVSLHQACESLRNRSCDLAVVSGINLNITESKMRGMKQAGMLAGDYTCYAFDNRANGLAAGEAAVSLVLKSFSKAKADGDSIYAVIAGSGINYDGKTNGITAPNGLAQESLLREVYQSYKINPGDISYYIAHGTGTKLGDPVEFNAMSNVYREFVKKKQSIPITSNKSNIGHTLAASGLVSLVHLVLAMKYNQIPPTLNFKYPNEFIEWEDSPFYINRDLRKWKDDFAEQKIGALSSFGMSGTNAHVVVRSYHDQTTGEKILHKSPVLLVFSAKTENSLQENINRFISYFDEHQLTGEELLSVAYTLMNGRFHFAYRYAAVIHDQFDLRRIRDENGLCANEVSRNFEEDVTIKEEIYKTLDNLTYENRISEDELNIVAKYYCMGYNLDYSRMFRHIPVKTVHLPVYEFEREAYWQIVPEEKTIEQNHIHPLLHKNTSDLEVCKYTTKFNGKEFFLRDHIIEGDKVLSGTAIIEMVRAAVLECFPAKNVITLSRIVWQVPYIWNEKTAPLSVRLWQEENDQVKFSVVSESVEHCSGKAGVLDMHDYITENTDFLEDFGHLNRGKIILGTDCYKEFDKIGFAYGKSYKCIQEIKCWKDEAFVYLQNPMPEQGYVIHPGLLDSAFQASIALMQQVSTGRNITYLPYAIDQITVYHADEESMYVHIQRSIENMKQDIQRFDLILYGKTGNICIKLEGLTLKKVTAKEDNHGRSEAVVYERVWCEVECDIPHAEQYEDRFVILTGFSDAVADMVKRRMGTNREINSFLYFGEIDVMLESYTNSIIKVLQGLMHKKVKSKILLQLLIPNVGNDTSYLASLSALLRTAGTERENMKLQLIEAEQSEVEVVIEDILNKSELLSHIPHIRYRKGRLTREELQPITLQHTNKKIWESEKNYLITGGNGMLAHACAKQIFTDTNNTAVILVGLGIARKHTQELIQRYNDAGREISYQELDVLDYRGLEQYMQKVNGVIHCAGRIRDSIILKKDHLQIKEVFDSKVRGANNIITINKNVQLDFIVFYSSTSAIFGNPGQADYAVANAFMNQITKSVDHGRTKVISLNWPYWKQGGMVIDKRILNNLEKRVGFVPLEHEKAFSIIHSMGKQNISCPVILYGNREKIEKWVNGQYAQNGISVSTSLYQLVSEILQVQVDHIEANVPLIDYGMDIIMRGELAEKLSKHFGVPFSSEVHFEYKTVSELIELLPGYEDQLLDAGQSQKEIAVEEVAIAEINEGDRYKEYMQQYLIQMVSAVLGVKEEKINIEESLSRYGLDSILILEVNNKLEEDFPGLSQTLFFEYTTIQELTEYFLRKHKTVVMQRAGIPEQNIYPKIETKKNSLLEVAEVDEAEAEAVITEYNENTNIDALFWTPKNQLILHKEQDDSTKLQPIFIKEEELDVNHEVKELIADIDRLQEAVGYERVLYSWFFITKNRTSYVRVHKDEKSKFLIPFMPLSKEVYRELKIYAEQINMDLLIVDFYNSWIDHKEFVKFPVGVWQDLEVSSFTTTGKKMRKLRYMADKFSTSGHTEIIEYKDCKLIPVESMRLIMEKWSESKQNVIKHSVMCMNDLLSGALPDGYRAFLTYRDSLLCSVIVIENSGKGSYLMDQEFYDPSTDMAGHMEYSICKMIELLKEEGAQKFSLGLTWYPFIFDQLEDKDDSAWEWLCAQGEKESLLGTILQAGKSNYQFKKKFGESGIPLYAYLPRSRNYSDVLNYWTIFYKNSIIQSEIKNNLLTEEEIRRIWLAKDKLANLDYYGNSLDMVSDSWFLHPSAAVKGHMEKAEYHGNEEMGRSHIKSLFPFACVIYTAHGKEAEELFYEAFPKDKKIILSAIPWMTTLKNALTNKYDVIEIPCEILYEKDSKEIFKGELSITALQQKLKEYENQIAMVCIEVLSNATGGAPVRLSHLKEVRNILKNYHIPLVLDASRIIRNAYLIKEYESDMQDRNVWDIVRDMTEQADVIVMSLTKDFGTVLGGMIACNDSKLVEDIVLLQEKKGYHLSQVEERMINKAISLKEQSLHAINEQMLFSRELQQIFCRAEVPLLNEVIGHAVVIPADLFISEFRSDLSDSQALLDDLFVKTGIRGSLHFVGKHRNSRLNNCIRLAISIGMTKKEQNDIYERLKLFFIERADR